MSLPSHMSTLGSLKPSSPVVTSVPAADWAESDSDSPSFVVNKPTAMRSPAALSFGQKTYDGSAAQTLTAADLGALTSHQDISGKADKSTTYTKTETDSAISSAVSAVRDSAPAAFDTLKEIADWIGDSGSGAQAVINQVSGKKDRQTAVPDPSASGTATAFIDSISQNENGVISATKKTVQIPVYMQADWNQTDTDARDYIKNKPAIPSPLALDPTLAVFGFAAEAKATGDALALKENASNKVTSLSAQSTDAQYPSAKCVYDELAAKADASSLPYALSAAEVLAEDTTDEPDDTITYGLADRTINDISIPSGKKYVTIVMPAVSVAGHARDFVVRLTVGAADINIIWSNDIGGVAVVDYETEDGEFPDLSEAGTYLVRLTETAAYDGTTSPVTPAKFLIQCQELQTAAGGAA